MNERIKELAKQAYEDVIRNTPSFLVTKEMYEQKFAELIVQECIKVCSDMAFSSTEPMKYMECEIAIAKHFGVE